ncbi:uncharacterized protein LOC134237917 [Saccostrea cucullata]|uniref:uncharacterized protein LOC134237917 n=1 Tax=Saccostrea cuccullata TaxID=36930 RepID=UPI002ED55FFB
MYLKSEYKFSVGLSSGCQDHCFKFALSHPTNVLLQEECDHAHEELCRKCNLVEEISSGFFEEVQKLRSSEIVEELSVRLEKAIEKISYWKAHILGTQNQEEGRYKILEELQPHQLLIIMDWAMKFLPAMYREKHTRHSRIFLAQSNKIGLLSHQLWSISFRLLRVQMPEVEEVFLRSDNAGCYHCGCLWLSLHGISERTGNINILRYDFSEVQAGKRMFVSSGKNVITPFDLKNAIMDGSGVVGCQCAVVEVDKKKQTMTSHCFKGVSSISNLSFEGEDIIAWHSFNVGIGVKINREDALKTEQSQTGLVILSDFEEEPQTQYGSISSQRKENCPQIFHCSVLGCNQHFSSYQHLLEHIELDRHVQEKSSTFDEIRHLWSETCHSNLFMSKQILQIGTDLHSVEDSNSSRKKLPQGWAIKKARKFARFSAKVKEFLIRVYQEGEKSGRKAPSK